MRPMAFPDPAASFGTWSRNWIRPQVSQLQIEGGRPFTIVDLNGIRRPQTMPLLLPIRTDSSMH